MNTKKTPFFYFRSEIGILKNTGIKKNITYEKISEYSEGFSYQ